MDETGRASGTQRPRRHRRPPSDAPPASASALPLEAHHHSPPPTVMVPPAAPSAASPLTGRDSASDEEDLQQRRHDAEQELAQARVDLEYLETQARRLLHAEAAARDLHRRRDHFCRALDYERRQLQEWRGLMEVQRMQLEMEWSVGRQRVVWEEARGWDVLEDRHHLDEVNITLTAHDRLVQRPFPYGQMRWPNNAAGSPQNQLALAYVGQQEGAARLAVRTAEEEDWAGVVRAAARGLATLEALHASRRRLLGEEENSRGQIEAEAFQVCSAVARQHQARLDALPQLAPRSPAPSAAATAVKHAEGSERTDLRTQESHAWGELMATFVSEAELLMWHARRQRSALLLDPERHEIVRSQHLNELQDLEAEDRWQLTGEETAQWLLLELQAPCPGDAAAAEGRATEEREAEEEEEEGEPVASRGATKARRRSRGRAATEAWRPLLQRPFINQQPKALSDSELVDLQGDAERRDAEADGLSEEKGDAEVAAAETRRLSAHSGHSRGSASGCHRSSQDGATGSACSPEPDNKGERPDDNQDREASTARRRLSGRSGLSGRRSDSSSHSEHQAADCYSTPRSSTWRSDDDPDPEEEEEGGRATSGTATAMESGRRLSRRSDGSSRSCSERGVANRASTSEDSERGVSLAS
eukprot:EG_transcript_2889